MSVDLIAMIGLVAAAATMIQIAFGQGGQLLRIDRCTAIEIRGIHSGAFVLNAASHCLWAVFGLGTASMIIFLPNFLGAVLSALIVVRVTSVRRSSQHRMHAKPNGTPPVHWQKSRVTPR